MADRVDQLEARIRQVEEALGRVERRLAALEGGAGAVPEAREAGGGEAAGPAMATSPGAPVDVPGVLSLVGRTSIVLGGAYLLRALTESGWLPAGAGVGVGLLYALGWLGAADRAAARGRAPSALFHGLAAVFIGFPLVWEASTRFGFFGAWASAGTLTVLTGLTLGVAWRRRLHGLAAVASLAALAAALALVAALGQAVPLAAFLVLVGVATLWLGYECDWYWLRWPAAIVANLVIIGVATRAVHQPPLERPGDVIALQVFLLAAYLASFAVRTLWRGRNVIPFEVVQTAAAVLVGLGGAIVVARASGTGETALGLASALLGAGGYAVAFAFVGRRQGLGTNFYFYATLALVLSLTGLGGLLSGSGLALALGVLSAATAWLGSRLSRLALTVHAAVYATGAAIVSGLLATAGTALVGAPGQTWVTPDPVAWVVLGILFVCVVIPRPAKVEAAAWIAGVPRFVLALLAVVSAGGALVSVVAPALAGAPPDAGVLATVRTAVLAVAAVLVAFLSRYDLTRELGWLLYPVLLAGGLKLLTEDFRFSRPSTLFIALALYGGALVAAPRIAKRVAGGAPSSPVG